MTKHTWHRIACTLALVAFAAGYHRAEAQQSGMAGHGHRAGVHAGAGGSFGGASAGGPSAAGASAAASGQGGVYMADHYLEHQVDPYQPWPQAEMQQFAKPEFIPFGQVRHELTSR